MLGWLFDLINFLNRDSAVRGISLVSAVNAFPIKCLFVFYWLYKWIGNIKSSLTSVVIVWSEIVQTSFATWYDSGVWCVAWDFLSLSQQRTITTTNETFKYVIHNFVSTWNRCIDMSCMTMKLTSIIQIHCFVHKRNINMKYWNKKWG